MKILFQKRFKELLNSTDLTYNEIIKKLGLKSKATITKYANGSIKNINLTMICKIADLFQVSPIWLIGWTNDKNYIIK